MKAFYVYIMASQPNGTLYIGVTSNLLRRVYEHKHGIGSQFANRYGVTMLVYYEESVGGVAAIRREKQLKGWMRRRKIALIEEGNPHWYDLSEGWFDTEPNTA